jgi:hypothetical protein
MPGLTFSNELISRDEGLHTDFACLLYWCARVFFSCEGVPAALRVRILVPAPLPHPSPSKPPPNPFTTIKPACSTTSCPRRACTRSSRRPCASRPSL